MATKKYPNVHDRFVRRNLSNLSLVIPILKFFLDRGLQARMDLDRLSFAKETYVGRDLDETITDLLYTAPFREHASYISLLIEHKSEGAVSSGHILPFQMRAQELRIMDHVRRNHKNKRYPIVYLLGFYHGEKAYSGPRSVAEQMDGPEAMIPARWREEIILVDLSLYHDRDLMLEGKAGIFLLVLKHIYSPNILEVLENLITPMRALGETEDGVDFLMTVFRYICEAAHTENRQELDQIALKSTTEELGGKLMTIANQIIEEARPRIIKEARPRIIKEARPGIIEKAKPGIIEEAKPIIAKQAIEEDKPGIMKKLAVDMLAEGVDLRTIARVTKLTIDEVQGLNGHQKS